MYIFISLFIYNQVSTISLQIMDISMDVFCHVSMLATNTVSESDQWDPRASGALDNQANIRIT